MAQLIYVNRIIERTEDEPRTAKAIINIAHVVSATPEVYGIDGNEYLGTRVVLSIGKTMLVELDLETFLARTKPQRKWWQ